MVANANKHTFDYGSQGVLENSDNVALAGLVLAGSGKDLRRHARLSTSRTRTARWPWSRRPRPSPPTAGLRAPARTCMADPRPQPVGDGAGTVPRAAAIRDARRVGRGGISRPSPPPARREPFRGVWRTDARRQR